MIKKHSLHTVAVMLLILVFALSIAIVLVNGSISYENISTTSQKSFDDRTSLSYISTKVKYLDNNETSIFVDAIDSSPALHIVETIEETQYSTWIYFYDGNIKELFLETSEIPEPQYGFDITPAKSLDFLQISNDLILVRCSVDGEKTAEAYLYLRSV